MPTPTINLSDPIAAAKGVRALLIERASMIEALQEAREFLAPMIDVVDGSYGIPRPNAAMSLSTKIDEALEKSDNEVWLETVEQSRVENIKANTGAKHG